MVDQPLRMDVLEDMPVLFFADVFVCKFNVDGYICLHLKAVIEFILYGDLQQVLKTMADKNFSQ